MYGDGIFRGVLSMVDDSYVSAYAQYKEVIKQTVLPQAHPSPMYKHS